MEERQEKEVGAVTGSNTSYSSILLSSKETIYWTVSNLSNLTDLNCWTAMTFSFDSRGSLGRSYTWRLSLDGDDDEYLYGRVELVAPINYRIPYSLKFYIINSNIKSSLIELNQEEEVHVREITNQSEPQKWKILDRKYLLLLQNPEDLLQLKVELICYGSETTQENSSIQNYPY